jgi:homoserine kinase
VSTMTIRAYAPASIGNFAAGFDILGAAVAPQDGSLLGDVVSAGPAEGDAPSLSVSGPYAGQLPADPGSNLVLRAHGLYREALRQRGLPCPPFAFHLEKNLPRCSGLGSSGSSVAATLAACQALLGDPLSADELLAVAGQAEALVSGSAHLDNVVSTLRGGLQLLVPGRDGLPEARTLPWPRDLVLAVISPDCELATERSRRVLPQSIPLTEAVAFAQNLAAFIHALESGDRDLLRRCVRDILAEPYRGPLVPGFRAAQAAALDAGAWGCTLSGSGPALFAVTDSEESGRAAAEAIQAALRAAGLASKARLCGIDVLGTRILP